MTRGLSKADRELWDRLRETVKPLRTPRPEKAPMATSPSRSVIEDADAAPKRARRRSASTSPKTAKANPVVPAPPSLAPLEEKTRRRLARGRVEIEAKIDLHGMRQERAFNALDAFLRRAQGDGARIVLVVTGKGKAGEGGRGILRESVPHWLSRGELRDFVIGFEPAARRHGGEGALYVRIRRRRAGVRPLAAKA